jgi:hypothetical protein
LTYLDDDEDFESEGMSNYRRQREILIGAFGWRVHQTCMTF